jgi:hypothetical protein
MDDKLIDQIMKDKIDLETLTNMIEKLRIIRAQLLPVKTHKYINSTDRYQKNEQYREIQKAKAREKYRNMTQEQKDKIKARKKERYHNDIEYRSKMLYNQKMQHQQKIESSTKEGKYDVPYIS